MAKETVNIMVESNIFQNVIQVISKAKELKKTSSGEDKGKPDLELIDYYQPPMKAGEYTVKISQSISSNGVSDTFTEERKIVVKGPFRPLNQTDVISQNIGG